jgi:hypothetical protein
VDFGFRFSVHKLVKYLGHSSVQKHGGNFLERTNHVQEQRCIGSADGKCFRRKNKGTLDRIAGNIDR